LQLSIQNGINWHPSHAHGANKPIAQIEPHIALKYHDKISYKNAAQNSKTN
jgi:hypothetical protein